MKRNMLILAVIAVFAYSCSKEKQHDYSDVVLTATLDNVDSKIVLDGLKSLWESDDAIVVNGKTSTKTVIKEGGKSAEFSLPVVSAPFNAVAPVSVYSSGKIVLPSTQTYREGSFDGASSVLLGYSSSTSLSFAHAMSYIKLTLRHKDDDDNIKSVEVSALGGENLSGSFTPNYAAASLSGASESKTVTLECGDAGLAQGTAMYIAIPAHNYSSGIKLKITDVAGHVMTVKSSKVFNAAQGKVYVTSVTFVPSETEVEMELNPLSLYTAKKILFIGNSHTLDATTYLPDLLRAENVRSVELTRVYHGGYYLVGYNTNYSLKNNCSVQTWKPGQFRWRGTIVQDHSLESVVESDVYDIVVLQEYTGSKYCYVSWSSDEKNAINGLIEKIHRKSPNAEIVYFLSHCWADNYSGSVSTFGGSSVTQFNQCVNNNLKHVMDPSEGFPITRFISTAALIQNLRTSGLNVNNGKYLLRGDGVHLDYGLGRISAAILMWKTLMTPLTGIEAGNLKFRFTEYYPQATKFTTPFIDENKTTVLAAVNAAYDHPDQITDMSSYSSVPTYVHIPGSYGIDMVNVDVEPVSFPVEFPIGYKSGLGWLCNNDTNPNWTGNHLFFCSQLQAIAKWVSVSNPVEGMMYNSSFTSAVPSNSVKINGVWTGDYFEFIIPVRNFRAGSTVRVFFPMYLTESPAFWYLDYKDGDTWKCNHSTISTSDLSFSHDASFVCSYGNTAVNKDVTFVNGIDNGFLRFRLRCADGTIQTTSDGFIQRSTPYVQDGEYVGVFYFYGTIPVSFNQTDIGKK